MNNKTDRGKENLVKKLKIQCKNVQNNKNLKSARGITLVALVITIIIIIILASITMNMAFGDNGLIKQAQLAKDMAANSVIAEQEGMNSLMGEFANTIAEPEEPEVIPESTSYIGYYADVDGDKEPDGVIYADLAFSKSGEWGEKYDGAYSYSAKTDLKEYYVSKEGYEGEFGPKDVLTAKEGSAGEERFYVMALENVNSVTEYCWYDAAYGEMDDYVTTTSIDFGKGRANTKTMIEKWNNEDYGAQNTGRYNDMWGVIQTEVGNIENPTWFVPSSAEWNAFADNLGINEDNYQDYGVFDMCWSSSQNTNSRAWYANFDDTSMDGYSVSSYGCVRLSATF